MGPQAPALELRGIGKSFSGVSVLRKIDLEIFPGEVHCIVGENGAGKSTLIKIISGAHPQDEGSLTYLGERLGHFTPGWARDHGIITIYQEIDLIPSLNVTENVFLGNEHRTRLGGIDWRIARSEAERLLRDIGVHVEVSIPIGRLRLAQQQMVAIAKALSLKSRLIILDEPTAVFTRTEIELLFSVLRKLKAQGIAIVYISHHLDEVFEIGDRVTVLRDGNLIRTERISDISKGALVKAMVGREIDFTRRNGRKGHGSEVLRVEHLTRAGVFDDVSFSLHRQEIVGVAGLVGAGRSDVARALVGASPVDSGSVTVVGVRRHITSPRQALSVGMGMLPESRKEDGLVMIRTVGENIGYALVGVAARWMIVPWRNIRNRVQQIVERVGVRPPRTNVQVANLSGGNQQKVVLGKWLAAGSEVLVLDEPTRGVDVGARADIYGLMQQLREDGKAILMVSSDMTEILTQSDRILVMAQGRIVGELVGADATEEKVLSLALRLGEAA